jgi:EAL domain-containing protein (putative c-di-GMP-specific phosphodiesterase class I)
MAHEAGVSKAIDLWMANQALEASVALGSRIQIRINIDSKQAADEAFSDELCRLWSPAPDGAFAIEMLESAALPDLERVKRFANRLSASGVEMSLDGYGSGHASMGLLNKLDLGSVKVDASMIRGPGAKSGARMGQSIAAVCTVHGIACMVTGLESMEDAKTALSWGVKLGQGHLIAEPMPWADVKKWLDDPAVCLIC